MAELITPEEAEKIESEVVERPRKKPKKLMLTPQSLEAVSGRDVIEILEFLHRKYLSWLTEAEGAKYSTLYRQAKDEALKEALEVYAEVQKQNQELLNKLTQLTEALSRQMQTTAPEQIAQEAAKQTVEEVKKSLLDDPRIRALGYVFFDYIASKNPELRKYSKLVEAILLGDLIQQEQSESSNSSSNSA